MQQQQIAESWGFIGQALHDFASTMQPSVAAAFRAAAQHHYAVLNPVIETAGAGAEPPSPAKPKAGKDGDSSKNPA